MATSNVRLHPIQFTIEIFLSFKLQTSPIQKRNKMREANKKIRQIITVHVWNNLLLLLLRSADLMCLLLIVYELKMCVCEKRSAFFLVGDCWCFLSCSHTLFLSHSVCLNTNYLNGTHRPDRRYINWHILLYTYTQTHTQQQHYESIYW